MKIAALSIIASAILAVVLLAVNKLWDPIAQYVGYPFDFQQRMEDLEEEVEKVRETYLDILRLDLFPWSQSCNGWKQRVGRLCADAETIKAAGRNGRELSYFDKCYYGKEADKLLKKATELVREGRELLNKARARPRQSGLIEDVQPRYAQNQLLGMNSYKQKVVDFIEDGSIQSDGLLGIWGMPGVGKTFLLKLVRDFPFKPNSVTGSSVQHALFDHVLFVQAGKESTAAQLQNDITHCMGLPDAPDTTSQGNIIRNHLVDKSFLLLIDDLWGYNHDLLEHVGIPMPLGTVHGLPHGGGRVQKYWRKVVFTTRSEDVCGEIGCPNNNIRLECLSKDDACQLFVDKVGNEIIKDTQLKDLATQLADECSGLPMALCSIGRAMSTRRDPREWRGAIDLLKDSKLLEIKMDKDLINRVKSSYDHMEDDRKNCFLISLLWPRGENIPKEKLVEWWTGLGLLDVTNAIYRGCMIINDLLRASMLEKGDTNLYSSENSHVKVHEVIREIALWILKDRRLLPLSFCRSALPEEKWRTLQKAWISAVDLSGWTSSVSCPQLTMLVSRHDFSFAASTSFQSITFLDLEGTKMDIFPSMICKLRKLQYLNLSATTIDALPLKLKDLSNLKYLYIRDNGALQAIPEELISQLAKLRVLDLFCSGTNSNDCQYFSSLIKGFPSKNIDLILGITVHTKQDIMKLIELRTVVHTQALCMHLFEADRDKSVKLELLCLMEKLRELTITNSPDIRQLVAKEHPNHDEYALLPYLEFLELSNLLELQEVTWKNAWLSIRVIVIYNCTKLRHVTWVQCLGNLEELTIAYCPELEKVIDNAESLQDMAVAKQVKSFGKLKKLYLEKLPKLSTISEHSRPFEELSYVFVARCENLKIIRVEQRSNHNKIKIDCNEDWWTSLGEDQEIMNLHFVPTFCL